MFDKTSLIGRCVECFETGIDLLMFDKTCLVGRCETLLLLKCEIIYYDHHS